MIQYEALVDTYLSANILLAEAVLLWLIARLALTVLGVRPSHRAQLILLNGVCLTVLISPLLVGLTTLGGNLGLLPKGNSVNLTDFMLSQYLNGHIDMAPTTFERALSLRGSFTNDLAGMQSATSLVVSALLATGVGLVTLRLVGNILKVRRTIRSSYAWRVSGSIHLRLSDTITVPFSTRGFRSRYVVVPSEMLAQQDDLKIVLQHEFQHLRQSDIEWEIAMECLRPLFFWNPAFHYWKRRVEELRELACDESILARKPQSVQSYCECLLRVCQNSLRKSNAKDASAPLVGLIQLRRRPFQKKSAVGLKRRIATIVEGKTGHSHRVLTGFVMLGLVGIIGTSALALQKPQDWSHDRIMLSTIVNLERLDRINSGMGTLAFSRR
jgi:hypothetical protein